MSFLSFSGRYPTIATGEAMLRSIVIWLVAAPVLVAMLLAGCSDESPTASDRAALVALYHATNGPNWANNSNWLSDRPLNEWHGVSTDGEGRVTGLALERNELLGAIPAELGSLSKQQARLRVLLITSYQPLWFPGVW